MSASLPVRSLLAATAAMLLLSACSTAYYTGDTISGPAQRMKRDADGNLHDPLLDAPNRSLMTCTSEAPVTVLQWAKCPSPAPTSASPPRSTSCATPDGAF